MKINREKLKPLGDGAEKMVYENPNNPEQAIGIFHEGEPQSPELTKGRFYLTKILHLLFPKNIPDMHLAATEPNMIGVDRVEDSARSFTLAERSGQAFRDLRVNLDSAGVTFDDYSQNLKFNKKGDLFYVDSFMPWGEDEESVSEPWFDKEKLEAAIQNLDDDKKELALSYFKRLDEMYKKALSNRRGQGAK